MTGHRTFRVKKVMRSPLAKKSIFAVLFALYTVFILLSQIPFIAEDIIDTSKMEDSYEYSLSFPSDGKQGHYYIERYDTLKTGYIHITYTTKSNSLEVECTNIKVLKIYCREMYEKKSEEVLKIDPALDSNYYKTYFIGRDHFHVHVFTQRTIDQLEFIDTPIPYNVTVNTQEWWLTNTNYIYNNDGLVLTEVPPGHSYVDIYFKSNDKTSPVAAFTASKTIVGVGESITFDASASNDADGEIISYAWDLGDGTFKGSAATQHTYPDEGTYKVILTVTDNDYLLDRAYQDIIVVQSIMNISKAVDKPIATPGSILSYIITPAIDTSWVEGVKEITITDCLADELDYVSATPMPQLKDRTLIWKLGIAFTNSELSTITLQTVINENVTNNSIITNNVTLEYNGIGDQQFPCQYSNLVTTKVKIGSILAPRIRSTVHNIELDEDAPPFDIFLGSYEYDFQDTGPDLNWYITDGNESLYQISGEYSENDILTITPLPNAFGNNLVTLWLIDNEGFTANQPLWINITPVNDAPIFSSTPDLIIRYDEAYTFNYEPYICDIDTSKGQLQLFASEKESIGSSGGTIGDGLGSMGSGHFQVTGFKVTYSYPESYIDKQIFVSLVIYDGNGSDGDNIQINITKDYTPWLKKELPDVKLQEGEEKINVFDLDDYFDDPDEDSLFYSIGDTHVSVIINENHTVDISSMSDWNGVDTITFRARDPIGALAEDTIFITVTPINDPPVIFGLPETFYVHYDADYSFDLTPYITDTDNDNSELCLILSDEHIRTDPLNQLRIIMNYPQAMLDMEISVKFIVSDGIDTGFQSVKVKVTDNWPPQMIKEISDISFDEDEYYINAFNLNDYFSDKDSDTLFYSYGQEFIKITINPDGSVDFFAIQNWNGVETVTFRATDSTYAFVESVITVSVIPVNDPPIIHPIPPQSSSVNHIWKLDLTKFIEDVDNDFSDLAIKAESYKLEIISSDGELLIYSDTAIVENVTIIISDGLSETSGSVLIEIYDDESNSEAAENFFSLILWLLIPMIIIIISITGYAGWRRYVGNYAVEEIFFIYNNGILISHATSKELKHRADEHVVSGMLTAIITFTQEAFTEEEKNKTAWGIKEIQMNEKNILVERGNYTFLATVFSGSSGKKLFHESRRMLENVENKYNDVLKSWKGNLNQLSGADKILTSMLSSRNKSKP